MQEFQKFFYLYFPIQYGSFYLKRNRISKMPSPILLKFGKTVEQLTMQKRVKKGIF